LKDVFNRLSGAWAEWVEKWGVAQLNISQNRLHVFIGIAFMGTHPPVFDLLVPIRRLSAGGVS
jgi:hypothetical protein